VTWASGSPCKQGRHRRRRPRGTWSPSVPAGSLCAALTRAVVALRLPGDVRALRPALAELPPVPDAEQDCGSFQQQALQPLGDVGLQVLLVHQAHDQDGLRQADNEQCHAHHKVDTCGGVSAVSGLAKARAQSTVLSESPRGPAVSVRRGSPCCSRPRTAVAAGLVGRAAVPINGVPTAVAGSVSDTMMRKTE